jgi:hypothetical protein
MQGEEKKTTEHTERRRKDTEKEPGSVYSVPFSVCSVVPLLPTVLPKSTVTLDNRFAFHPLDFKRRTRMRLKTLFLHVIFCTLASTCALAQTSAQPAPGKPKPIQDNSMLVEEAYNQEAGVVQHINNLTYSLSSGNWFYSFTQEWPLWGLKHQFSYTIPTSSLDDTGQHGIGDILLNYRYQLTGNSDSRLAIAPRFSVILPTGDSSRGLGSGATGIQFNLPVTFMITEKLASHSNVGFTYTHNGKNVAGDTASLESYNLGQSLIWLVHPRVNLMLESILARVDQVVARGIKDHETQIFVNPGVRWSYDVKHGLQIVPGVAFPIGLGRNSGDVGVLFYLSFEHPFKH